MNRAAQHDRGRVAAVFMLAIMGALAVHSFYRNLFSPYHDPIDFHVFHRAARSLAAGESPYRLAEADWMRPFLYPQAMALLLTPLTRWSVETAGWIWLGLNTFLLAVIAAFGVKAGFRIAADSGKHPTKPLHRRFAAVIAAIAVLGFSPVHFGMRIGQCDLLVAALLLPILFSRSRARPVLAGICLGLGTVFKVSPAILLPALVAALGIRVLVSFCGVICFYVLMLTVTGTFHREYELFTVIIPQWQFNVRFPEHSVYRLVLAPFFTDKGGYYGGLQTWAITGVLLALYGIVLELLRRRRADVLPFLAVGIAFAHLTSPVLEPHHYALTLLVLVPWIVSFLLEADMKAFAAIVVCWLIGFLFLPFHNATGLDWPSYSLLLTDCMLILVALARPRRERHLIISKNAEAALSAV